MTSLQAPFVPLWKRPAKVYLRVPGNACLGRAELPPHGILPTLCLRALTCGLVGDHGLEKRLEQPGALVGHRAGLAHDGDELVQECVQVRGNGDGTACGLQNRLEYLHLYGWRGGLLVFQALLDVLENGQKGGLDFLHFGFVGRCLL